MSMYKCEKCTPACFLMADDDDEPETCAYKGTKTLMRAEWRRIG